MQLTHVSDKSHRSQSNQATVNKTHITSNQIKGINTIAHDEMNSRGLKSIPQGNSLLRMCRYGYGCNSSKNKRPHIRFRARLLRTGNTRSSRSDRRLVEVGVALGEVPRCEEGAGHDPRVGDLLPLGRLICETQSNAKSKSTSRADRSGTTEKEE